MIPHFLYFLETRYYFIFNLSHLKLYIVILIILKYIMISSKIYYILYILEDCNYLKFYQFYLKWYILICKYVIIPYYLFYLK